MTEPLHQQRLHDALEDLVHDVVEGGFCDPYGHSGEKLASLANVQAILAGKAPPYDVRTFRSEHVGDGPPPPGFRRRCLFTDKQED